MSVCRHRALMTLRVKMSSTCTHVTVALDSAESTAKVRIVDSFLTCTIVCAKKVRVSTSTFEKSRVLLKKPTGLGFFGFYRVFFGFYWVLSGFIGFFVRVQFLPDQIMVLLNFNFRFSSKYITFYAETTILTCKSDQSQFICMAIA